jgi:uncharacterized protein YcaQ
MEHIDPLAARRLALARSGLLKPSWTALPSRAKGRGQRARSAALEVIRRFGYVQLDTVSIAGARSHALVLLSRLAGLDNGLPEELLQPGVPLFEYWGHEASWLPMELYPVFAFRRRAFRAHPWWGDLVGAYPRLADDLLRRIREEGPLRSLDLEGAGSRGWWDLKPAKKVASALWSCGVLAIRQRHRFQRTYDLAERVIPEELRNHEVPLGEALKTLLLKALDGHGWARTGTLTATWRLRKMQREVATALAELVEEGQVAPCELALAPDQRLKGWIRPRDLDLAERLRRVRPRRDQGVLLSPFDPVLWDRSRVKTLFGFEQVLEIFKPAPQRVYGYYCLPVLAGDALVARYDLKAHRKAGTLEVLALHYEDEAPNSTTRQAVRIALARYAESVHLRPIA